MDSTSLLLTNLLHCLSYLPSDGRFVYVFEVYCLCMSTAVSAHLSYLFPNPSQCHCLSGSLATLVTFVDKQPMGGNTQLAFGENFSLGNVRGPFCFLSFFLTFGNCVCCMCQST